MGRGVIYILINAVQEGYLKIGKTSRTAQERANELNRQGKTSLAGKHIVAYEEEVENYDLVEYLVHEKLKKHRTNSKEFFHISLRDAINTVRLVIVEMEKQRKMGNMETAPPKASNPFSWWGNLNKVWKQIFKSHLILNYNPTDSELIEGITNIIYYSRNQELRTLISKLIIDKDYQRKIGAWYEKQTILNKKVIKSYLSKDVEEFELEEILRLKELNCIDNLFIDDLSPVSYLRNLEILNCRNTSIKDIEIVRNIPTLRELNINFTEVENIEPIFNLPALKMLSCYESKVSNEQIEDFMRLNPDCEIEKSYFGNLTAPSNLKQKKKL